jgi:restriction endonuclease Mrr
LLDLIEVDAPPRRAIDWLVQISLSEGWHRSEEEALEVAERWKEEFMRLLREEISGCNRAGKFTPVALNSSSEEFIQGSAFSEPQEPQAIRSAKLRLARHGEYAEALRNLSPREFEALCAGLLHLLGVDNPRVTPYSSDEGIDFYGRLFLGKIIRPDLVFGGALTQMSAWLIGQAKHYTTGRISTFEVRELVGAVELAKGGAFASLGHAYSDLKIRVCDPIFYLFFTTGRITANSWRLLDRSGIAAMDGNAVASFLAEHAIGVTEDGFSLKGLREWLSVRG